MTQLLVSVRNTEEACLALDGGAHVIDVKDPSAGSLGATSSDIWAEVRAATPSATPVSVALGELLDQRAEAAISVPAGIDFAKIGLARCATSPGWAQQWRAVIERLPATTSPVAVAYADWRHVAAPSPSEVIDTGHRLGCAAVLFDTHDKTRGDLFRHLPIPILRNLIEQARYHRMWIVLAGSLSAASLPTAVGLRPDLVAVRGAVCHPCRTGSLQAELVRDVRAQIQQANEARIHR